MSISQYVILHNILKGENIMRLKEIREDSDIKQKEIADFLHIKQNTYSQYETGVISLTAEVLVKLADYYGVTVDYLLDRTNKPN